MRTLSRLMTPASGYVYLDGEQISAMPAKRWRNASVCWRKMPPPGDITVQELVARGRYPHQPLFTRWRKEDDDAVNSAMRATGITDLARQSVDTLSGGQRRGPGLPWCWRRKRPLCCSMSPPPGWISAIKSICWSC
ncbi:hypothetical protein DMH27_22065 [Raoultella planticola]|nr:hypothetical protein [Raoultella planticola]